MKLLVCIGALLLASVNATFRREYSIKYLTIPQQPIIIGKFPEPFDTCFYNDPISATAYFDMNGIRGSIQFYQAGRDQKPVTISVALEGLNQFPDEELRWEITECPVNFGLLRDEPCSSRYIGDTYDPEGVSSDPDCTGVFDFTERHGPLSSTGPFITTAYFEDDCLDLFGQFSPVGRSILIRRESGFRLACANVNFDANNRVETLVAPFPYDPLQQDNTIQGEIVLRRPKGRCCVFLNANFYLVDGSTNSALGWSLRRGDPGVKGDCSDLSDEVYGENTYAIKNYQEQCNEHQLQCYIGDLNGKCGQIERAEGDNFQLCCSDCQIGRIPQSDINRLSIAVEDENGTIIACSKFLEWTPRAGRADVYDFKGRIWLNAFFYQEDPHDDTVVRTYIIGLDPSQCYYLQIREGRVDEDTMDCRNLGPVYEPRYGFDEELEQSGVIRTGDKVYVGELTNKLPPLCGNSYYAFSQRNSYITMFGEYDIVGRALVLHEERSGEPVVCANIEPYSGRVSDSLRKSLLGYHY